MTTDEHNQDNIVRDVRFDQNRGKCPNCGSRKVVPIVYGYPAEETVQRQFRDEVELGGCVVTGDDPERACKDCRARF